MMSTVVAHPSDKPYPRFVTRRAKSLNGLFDEYRRSRQSVKDILKLMI